MCENKTPHPHAESMALYAQDAAETDRPWERWETADAEQLVFKELNGNPTWSTHRVYRRKRKTVMIGKFECVAPETVAPKAGTACWIIGFGSALERSYWHDNSFQRNLLAKGSLFLTREDAEAMLHAQTQQRLGLA